MNIHPKILRDARDEFAAILQTKQYIQTVPDFIDRQIAGRHLFLGNNQYLFVIMGLSDELIFQAGKEVFWQMIRNELPANLQILPYDILFRNFDKTIYRQIHILVPQAPAVAGFMRLRSKPVTLSIDDVKKMLQEKGFYDRDWNFAGKGVKHQYQVRANGKVVYDATTGLTWQQGGLPGWRLFEQAQDYIQKINKENNGSYSDWRLPTLEEAMSLMEPEKNHRNVHIDPVFDSTLYRIWTADRPESDSASRVWVAFFNFGICYHDFIDGNVCVRAVR